MNMNRLTATTILWGSAALLSGLMSSVMAQTTPQKQQPVQQQQQQKPVQQQTFVPARPSAMGQAKTAAQGPAQAVKVFDGGKVNSPTPVQVQTSTGTANAAAVAARENAAEKARQVQTMQKYNIDKSRVP
jgi:predicted lipid-binding transport protein (Tim44 family)